MEENTCEFECDTKEDCDDRNHPCHLQKGYQCG